MGFFVRPFPPKIHVVGDPGEPAFGANWAAAAGFQVPRFWKTADGVVHIEGVAENGTDIAPSTIFTLPAGFRPAATLQIGNAGAGNRIFEIRANGDVVQTAGVLTPDSSLTAAFLAA